MKATSRWGEGSEGWESRVSWAPALVPSFLAQDRTCEAVRLVRVRRDGRVLLIVDGKPGASMGFLRRLVYAFVSVRAAII